jgi:uncharacterized protein
MAERSRERPRHAARVARGGPAAVHVAGYARNGARQRAGLAKESRESRGSNLSNLSNPSILSIPSNPKVNSKGSAMFIDAHLHTIRFPGLPRNAAGDNFATPTELLAMMDRTGVDKGVLLPDVSPECCFQLSTCEDILEICAQHPSRFIPFCNVDPRAVGNSPTTDLSFALRYYRERGCRGVGEITASLPFTDPLLRNLFRHCEACQLPVIFHIAPQQGGFYGLVDSLGLPGLEQSLRDFPKLIFIGHSQPFWAEISGGLSEADRNSYPPGPVAPGGALVRLLDRYPNLCCGWDAGSGYNGLTRDPEFGWRFMESYRERILFGTDICSPKNDHRHAEYLRQARAAGHISQAAFEDISWRNANRILQLGL